MLVANPYWLGLPGAGAVSGFTVLIAMYIPTAILVGAAAGWLDDRINTANSIPPIVRTAFSLVVVLFLLAAGLWGFRQRLHDLQPSTYALATRPDIQAAAWIRENTVPSTRLLVNSFSAFNNYVIVGSDGGWWLPLLTGRMTTVPPINYGFEKDPTPGYRTQLNSLTLEIQAKGIQSLEVLSQLRDRGISYVYLGQRQGRVNSGGQLFTAEQLLTAPNFRLVYHQDRVWVFEFVH
jgi:hypothetical protein